ncbi:MULTISPECIES: PRC-barrel domain-containing protein [Arthrobacter]|uniref:PRC-barrel domain-containing protein n=1 Tax=Arthrobacter jinronghuae TaxID=2964609 RepID=A0ABT1NMK7_9MICC|nr:MULTISPECIES: PRC-barrel domain-containing protein [Arthrobacter]MCQ1948965.1 PRC-barrel domain-containing protein [Arthrobacter jinronghuae]MCQ1952291.1 PRC-barrel domain-containing protein [Arthrobacter sp. zg-Y238]UWX78233.1 PRC-barrel domain-containing protein [Arthrobacter jinronghuae]
MADAFTLHEIQGSSVWAKDGERLGLVGEVHLDRATAEPVWITVDLGLFETEEHYVPLTGARRDGQDIFVNYSREQVSHSPGANPENPLSPAEESVLMDYYRLR